MVHTDDYIAEPRDSGYRGIHFVSRFQPQCRDEDAFEGMRIEIQLRSRLQHVWATAVETAAIFSGESAQVQRWGQPLAPTVRAYGLRDGVHGRDAPCAGNATDETGAPGGVGGGLAWLRMRWRDSSGYRETLRVLEGRVRNGWAEYFHITLDPISDDIARVRWNEYAADQRDEAIRAFEEVEAAIEHFPGADTVLVRVASIETLRDAYPSYFADTSDFVDRLKGAIG